MESGNDNQSMDTLQKNLLQWTKLDLELKELNKKCSDIRKKKEIRGYFKSFLFSRFPILHLSLLLRINKVTCSRSEGNLAFSHTFFKILNEKIRPAVAKDGGDIKFKEFINGTVKVQLQGSCSGCPSSTMTLKQGVQNLLCHYIPEVQKVEAI